MELPPPPLIEQKWFETGCNVNIVYGNLESENSQDYVQKPQQNCTFMNSASGLCDSSPVITGSFVIFLQGSWLYPLIFHVC